MFLTTLCTQTVGEKNMTDEQECIALYTSRYDPYFTMQSIFYFILHSIKNGNFAFGLKLLSIQSPEVKNRNKFMTSLMDVSIFKPGSTLLEISNLNHVHTS